MSRMSDIKVKRENLEAAYTALTRYALMRIGYDTDIKAILNPVGAMALKAMRIADTFKHDIVRLHIADLAIKCGTTMLEGMQDLPGDTQAGMRGAVLCVILMAMHEASNLGNSATKAELLEQTYAWEKRIQALDSELCDAWLAIVRDLEPDYDARQKRKIEMLSRWFLREAKRENAETLDVYDEQARNAEIASIRDQMTREREATDATYLFAMLHARTIVTAGTSLMRACGCYILTTRAMAVDPNDWPVIRRQYLTELKAETDRIEKEVEG